MGNYLWIWLLSAPVLVGVVDLILTPKGRTSARRA
jgi:hypothetical protein